MGKNKLNDEKKEAILKLFYDGKDYKEIGSVIGVNENTIYRFIKSKSLKSKDRTKDHRCNFDFNEIGRKYSWLTIIDTEYSDSLKTWCAKCVCDCGNETIDTLRKVKNGEKKTCGNKNCKYHLDLMRLNGSLGNETTGYEEILGSRWASWRIGAKNRNIEFNITIEEAWNVFEKQNGKCALTGVNLKFKKGNNKEQTASLDRIDSTKHYTKDNIQWVHKEINRMKGSLQEKEFIDFCKKVVLWNKS